jgi:hypothetical protein
MDLIQVPLAGEKLDCTQAIRQRVDVTWEAIDKALNERAEIEADTEEGLVINGARYHFLPSCVGDWYLFATDLEEDPTFRKFYLVPGEQDAHEIQGGHLPHMAITWESLDEAGCDDARTERKLQLIVLDALSELIVDMDYGSVSSMTDDGPLFVSDILGEP